MYVPTFQGLSAFDWVRPAGAPQCFPFSAPHLSFYRARNAIYHLFTALQAVIPRVTVLVPDYNSGNEVLALRAAGAQLHFYRVNRDMQPELADIERLCQEHSPEVLYVIHYLGWPQPLGELARICRERSMLMVEDCALSLLSEPGGVPLGSIGDWSIFCLYKTLPVPNGALLVQNTMPLGGLDGLKLRQAGVASVAGRIAELMVQRLRARVDGAGRVLQSAKRAMGRAAGALEVGRASVGDIGFNLADVDLAMSGASSAILRRLNFDRIRERRKANYQRLAGALHGRARPAIAPLPDGACPLFYPILVDDKPAAARSLRAQGVDVLEFWNYGAETEERSEDVRFLRRHVMGLPIHQDLSSRQLNHVARQVGGMQTRAAA
ncbi:MAG TPA: DegT/DnrJ/EryC1/StrS family aminotransferase [Vicinamibacterales bacterium]|nr:DegT/DnrJ/EryC1/StrS family aminotransferase [Vicinamibacterales bacterium]